MKMVYMEKEIKITLRSERINFCPACKSKRLEHLSVDEIDEHPESANYFCVKCKKYFLIVDCGNVR